MNMVQYPQKISFRPRELQMISFLSIIRVITVLSLDLFAPC